VTFVARFTNLGTRLPAGKYFTRLHREIYRRTNGRLMGTFFGAPVLLLEVVGRRSGLVRETPMIYLLRDDTPVVLASNAGAARVPSWWLNLRAAGTAWIRLRGQRYQVRIRELAGEERGRTWQAFREMYPAIDDYAGFTTRELPLVALERI
jgi:deazaflavin-dependent oxidoreductase (nitroreductase family)